MGWRGGHTGQGVREQEAENSQLPAVIEVTALRPVVLNSCQPLRPGGLWVALAFCMMAGEILITAEEQ